MKNFRIKGNVHAFDAFVDGGIKEYFVESHVGRGAISILIKNSKLTIKIYPQMNDIDDWDEVGSLVVEEITNICNLPKMTSATCDWNRIKSVEKLEIINKSFSSESGLIITNIQGAELVIVCSREVLGLAVSEPFSKMGFYPEFPFAEYNKNPL